MVRDVQGAIDFLIAEKQLQIEYPASQKQLPEIDIDNIYCVGYSVGGMVGLYAAALDERITGKFFLWFYIITYRHW